jgi:hypothetical protein
MKLSKLIIILTIVLISSKSSAQEGWRIGFEGGALFSRTFFTDTVKVDYEKKYYTGYRFGAVVNWGRSEGTGFSLGAHFVNKGTRYQYSTGFDTLPIAQIKQGTQFLEIPFCMIFKQDLGITGFIRESFGIGAAFQLTKYDSFVTNSESNIFSMYNSRNSSVNAYFRLGVEFGNRFDNGDLLTLGVHYQQGFGTVSNQNFYNPAANTNIFNTRFNGSYIGITLGYHFNLSNIGSKEEFFTSNKPKYRF